ncbi:MAG: thioredoxin domain-containing protein [Deltaproteobacteria bacterium]|nr:thioredoxin domain-containing protein [Deltaproteobacteria bacterium]
MRKSLPYGIVMAICCVALVASAMLLVDYVRPAPVFCDGAGSGCAAVKQTGYARPFGIPMPLLGIGGFLAIALQQSIAGRRARIAQAMLAVFAGIVGAGLLVVQATMKKWCPFCIVTDTSSIVLLGLSVARAVKEWDPPATRGPTVAGLVAACLSIAVPMGYGMSRRVIPTEVPDVIAAEMKKTGAGRVTVVDFVDFECPFCRMTHTELKPLLDQRKAKVRVVRKHVPLRMHPHAVDAAKTACCGAQQGKEEEITEALFSAPPETLTREGCEELAAKQGLDVAKFKECFDAEKTMARIRADGEAFRAAQGHGLPTIFVDGQKLEGAQDRETLESVLDGAIRAL